MNGMHFLIEGRVQGVGFRYWAAEQARRLGLRGWVRNRPDGSVEAEAAGAPEALEEFARLLRQGPPSARVARVVERPSGELPDGQEFRIL